MHVKGKSNRHQEFGVLTDKAPNKKKKKLKYSEHPQVCVGSQCELNQRQLLSNVIIKSVYLSQGLGLVTAVIAVGRGLSCHKGMKLTHQIFPAGLRMFGKKPHGSHWAGQ